MVIILEEAVSWPDALVFIGWLAFWAFVFWASRSTGGNKK